MAIRRRDHVTESLAALPPTLDKPNWRGLIGSVLAQVQAIEDATISAILQRALPDAEGAQLDQLGKLVGQPRDGREDEDYRRVIGAKIAVNESQGGREDLIRVARLALLDSSVRVRLEAYPLPGAEQGIVLEGEVSHEAATDVLAFAKRAAAAGVRVIVESWPDGADGAFRLDDELPGKGFDEPPRVEVFNHVGNGFDTIVLAHPDHADAGLTLAFVEDSGADPGGELDETGYPAIVVRFVDGVTTINQIEDLLRGAKYVTLGQASSVPGPLYLDDDDFGPVPFADAITGGVLATSMDGHETYPP
jgi:hypothetical protein